MMATSLPGFRGVPSQDAQILAMKAGPTHPDHGRGGHAHHAGQLPMPVYGSPVPPAAAENLQGFGGGLSRDRTPRTHAAPTTAWAQMDAGTAQAVSNQIHGVRFAWPRTSQYIPANRVPTELVNDVNPGDSRLARDVPAQLRHNGRGSGDVAQGGGVPNGYGFGAAHVVRWRSTGWVPIWHVGSAERPIRMDPMQGRNRTYSVDSRLGPGGAVAPMAARYTGAPTAYQVPANPSTGVGYSAPGGFAW